MQMSGLEWVNSASDDDFLAKYSSHCKLYILQFFSKAPVCVFQHTNSDEIKHH